jgi:hypothetical protein
VWLGRGDGSFQFSRNYDVGWFPVNVAVGDFHGNGAYDLVTVNLYGSTVSVLTNLELPRARSLTLLGAPSTTTAGRTFTVTAEALSVYGTLATSYRGTVQFLSSDPAATFNPNPYTFTPADRGRHTFTITLRTAGEQSVTVRDVANSLISSINVSVVPDVPSTFLITGLPSSITAGVPVPNPIIVTVKDRYGNTVPSYRGVTHFTSSDAAATYPGDTPFTGADNGMHIFPPGTIIFRTAGGQTLTVSDSADHSITGTSPLVTVLPDVAVAFSITGLPATLTAGEARDMDVTATDRFQNRASGYTGTVHFSSSDYQAMLPEDRRLTNGVGTFRVTLKTVGTQSITATDTADGHITGTQPGIVVTPAAASSLRLDGPTTVAQGYTYSFTIRAKDPYGNTDTNYVDTVSLTTTDPDATLDPPEHEFTATDRGMFEFSVTFRIVVDFQTSQSISASDTAGRSGGPFAVLVKRVIFQPAVEYSVNDAPTTVAVGHFHRAGIPDIVSANGTSHVFTVLLGNGDGTFQAPLYSYYDTPFDGPLVVGDFENRQIDDVAVKTPTGIDIYLSNGDGTFESPHHYDVPTDGSSNLVVGDFTGNGLLDLALVGNVTYPLTYFYAAVLLNVPGNPGTFHPTVSNLPVALTHLGPLGVGDFTGNGQADLAVLDSSTSDASIHILLSNGDGTFGIGQEFSVPAAPRSVQVGDFSGNGNLDLVVGVDGAVMVFPGNGDGTFITQGTSTPVDSDGYTLVQGDFNNDGDLDVAVVNRSPDEGVVSVLLGNGDGTFRAPVEDPVNIGADSSLILTGGDFKGDQYTDLVVASPAFGNNSVFVLLNAVNWPDGGHDSPSGAPLGAADSGPGIAVMSVPISLSDQLLPFPTPGMPTLAAPLVNKADRDSVSPESTEERSRALATLLKTHPATATDDWWLSQAWSDDKLFPGPGLLWMKEKDTW